MDALAGRVIATIERHAMFVTGQRIGIAVSGGADSMCLLHLLHELAPRWNLHLSVVHVEHGIRGPASSQDAEFVRAAASEFGLPCHSHSANVPAIEDNLEQAARHVRHTFYRELIGSGHLDRIATGHTASDQAETVMYRILRGSGLSGLSGIRPITTDGFVRPMLNVWRREVEAWLRERNIAWREDASNQDLTFARNRLRHETLPMLREAFNPNLDQILAHMAILAQDEEAYWDQIIDPTDPLPDPTDPLPDPTKPSPGLTNPRPSPTDPRPGQTDPRPSLTEPRPKGAVLLSTHALTHAPPALSRRRIRRAIEQVKGNLRQIDFSHVELVLEMARAEAGSGRTQLPGIDVYRSFDWIRIAPTGFDSGFERDFQFPITVPGSIALPRNGPIVTFELIEREGGPHSYDKVEDELDWQRLLSVSAPEARGKSGVRSCLLELRNWRPGDQYCPIGQSRQKVKTLFQTARIPLWERRHWPVVTCYGEIAWVRRFGPAADFAASPVSGSVLRIREHGGDLL